MRSVAARRAQFQRKAQRVAKDLANRLLVVYTRPRTAANSLFSSPGSLLPHGFGVLHQRSK
jgi:hypothetical protein